MLILALRRKWRIYLMEAFGLFIFMVSACFFTAVLEHPKSTLHLALPEAHVRLFIMAFAMMLTAAVIFFSPYTAPSGSYINPAVSLVHVRLGNMSWVDCFWYTVFQIGGGLAGVYFTWVLLGHYLSDAPVHFAVTVPGKSISVAHAAAVETTISIIMILMVLFTQAITKLKRYTNVFAAVFVGLFVFFAGPVSGFGMNPARTIASAIPARVYTAFWLYMICPVAGMLAATELFLSFRRFK